MENPNFFNSVIFDRFIRELVTKSEGRIICVHFTRYGQNLLMLDSAPIGDVGSYEETAIKLGWPAALLSLREDISEKISAAGLSLALQSFDEMAISNRF
jgi:hypothetical protein